jgi:hypothetical protein
MTHLGITTLIVMCSINERGNMLQSSYDRRFLILYKGCTRGAGGTSRAARSGRS